MRRAVVLAACALFACEARGGPAGAPKPAASGSAVTLAVQPPAASDLARVPPSRQYATHVPRGWDHARPLPLVVFLHGYGSSGAAHARMFALEDFADEQGFVLALPDGTVDSRGKRFWNATDACCDFDGAGVDDVGYVASILDDVEAKMPVDRDRVYVVGHSNGGFLAHRLACDLAPRIAAAVSLAGAVWKDAARCAPSEPVSVLEIHGGADDVIRPGGGRVFDLPVPEYPAVRDTVATWVARDACGAPPSAPGPAFDFDLEVPGPDTTAVTYAQCRSGVTVDLWTEARGTHLPRPSPAGLRAIWAWMTAHPKRR